MYVDTRGVFARLLSCLMLYRWAQSDELILHVVMLKPVNLGVSEGSVVISGDVDKVGNHVA